MRRQKQSILKPEFKNILPWVNLIRSHKTSKYLLWKSPDFDQKLPNFDQIAF